MKVVIILLTICTIVNSKSIRMRGLELTESVNIKPIPCNLGTNGTNCVCPAECLMYVNSTGGCHPINCWSYSEIKKECSEAGKEFVPALVLQSIPLTGVFGSGFGNMGRWDIFSTYMGVMFGGCCLICLCACIPAITNAEQDGSNTMSKLASGCTGCIWAIALLVFWIWGIVVIANKEVDAPWTDWQGNSISCPLV